MPPRFGKLPVTEWGKSAPIIDGYGTEPWKLRDTRLLELRYEIDDDPADGLLPPALHPAMPAYATFTVLRVGDSPVGGFTMGEVRIAGRAGGRPVGFVLGSFCDSEAAGRELSARWGYPFRAADIKLTEQHYGITASVRVAGVPVLELELRNRKSLPSVHLQPLPSMNLARNRQENGLVLVEVDVEAVFAQSDGGSEGMAKLNESAFPNAEQLRLMSPMSSVFALAELTLARIQIICDPEQPAETHTTYLD